MKKIYSLLLMPVFLLAFCFLSVRPAHAQSPVTVTFLYTGATQSFVVPSCVGSMTITAWAASGSPGGTSGGTIGLGGVARAVITATPGQTMFFNVGGQGSVTAGGFNGGGNGGISSTSSGGGGGGASDVRIIGNTLADRILVAGGGGGGGGNSTYNANGGSGGAGSPCTTPLGVGGGAATGFGTGNTAGGCSGGTAPNYASGGAGAGLTSGGGGGGQPSSSTGGYGCNGALGIGGDGGGTTFICGGATNGVNGGGGGGGGYYGGGGGMTGTGGGNGGGGGGSSYGGSSLLSNVSFTGAAVTGNGSITITYAFNGPGVTTNTSFTAICNGNSASLNAGSVVTYTWLPVGAFPGSNASNIVVNPSSTTVYTVNGTNSIGCVSSTVVTVNVAASAPVLTVTASSNSVCLGQGLTLTATGALTYTWSNSVVNAVTFTPSATNVYTVSGTNGCGTSVATKSVLVGPIPVTVLATPTLVCEGYTSTLTAVSSVNNYTWLPGPQLGNITTVGPTATTIYTVIASDGTCYGTATLQVTTKTTPSVSINQTLVTMCLGQVITLTANGAGTGGSYSWTPGNATTASFTTSPPTTTLYVVSGTNSLNCTASAQVPVVVVQPLPLNVSASSTLVCTGAAVTFTASGSNSYVWTNGPNTSTYQVNPTAAVTVYTVTGANTSNTCTATQTIAVSAITPSVSVTTPVSMCTGGSATVTATGANTYTWNGTNMGSTNVFVAAPAQTTTYVLVANTNSLSTNCISTHSAVVNVNPNPTVTVVLTKTTTICKGNTNTITAGGAVSYTWASNNSTATAITVSPNVTTNYSVTGKDANGCMSGTEVQVKVSNCNGIKEENNFANIAVYPNPNNGTFSIKADSDLQLILTNAVGQEIRKIHLNSSNDFSVQINDLSNGIYFIAAESGGEKYTSKIVVSK